jgi:hypothetical protein
MKNPRLLLFALIAALPIVLWLVWPDGDSPSQANNSTIETDVATGRLSSRETSTDRASDPASRASRGLERKPAAEAAMAQVNHLLSNPALEDDYVVGRLREIAADTRLSLPVRSEAMGHGLLLDVPPFADLAAQSDLPAELAEALLGGVINSNENPAMQIEVYMNLMNHSSAGIREEALEMLRFMVEDDFEEADMEGLRRMAEAKLSSLAASGQN